MNPVRKQRLYIALFLLVVVSGTATALMLALQQDINLFYPPDQVASGEAPRDVRIRAGGMVLEGSVERSQSDLSVQFVLTDRANAEFAVRYKGILPDLFREGQGIVVQGKINGDGVFIADEVLAKHDENYMPPELMDMNAEANAPKKTLDTYQ